MKLAKRQEKETTKAIQIMQQTRNQRELTGNTDNTQGPGNRHMRCRRHRTAMRKSQA